MIGLDTNILVRHLTQDDEKLAEFSTQFLEKNCTDQNPGFISTIMLNELYFVLRKGYKYSKEDCLLIIKKLTTISAFYFENRNCVLNAIREFEKGNAGFTDYLIGEIGKENGCEFTATLDLKASKSSNFKYIGN